MKSVNDALSRLSGVRKVTIKLQENLVIVETEPTAVVQPSAIWKEVMRVGFVPENMELWAEGVLDSDSFEADGGRWQLTNRGPTTPGRRKVHLRVLNGGQDPLKVGLVD